MEQRVESKSNSSNDTSAAMASQQTTGQIAAKAHDTIDRVADTAGRAEQGVRESAAKVKERAMESEERVQQAADETVRKAESYIQQHPIFSAGVAIAAGFVLSSLLRR
jgi:ElaB/YqjD/DUF883 family membrane-anchored ribosome-binding protein